MSLVESFTHLKGRPKADDALPLLKRIASLVKPVMRKHDWVLPVLAEFFPDEPSLLGLNMNSGQKILLRLRPPWSPDTFYDEDQLVSVMLHELAHNVCGPHDEKFYKYLYNLEAEYDTIRRDGYDGEGFESTGQRLGVGMSHNLPPRLARAKALQAAEKRRAVQKMLGNAGGKRLGGRPPMSGSKGLSPRELAVQAAERRARDEKSCGTSKESAQREAEKAAKDSVEGTGGTLEDVQGTADYDSAEVLEPNGNNTIQSSRSVLSDENGWPCAVCTLDNLPSASHCLACLSLRPKRDDGSLPRLRASSAAPSSRSSSNLGTFSHPRLVASSMPQKKAEQRMIETGWTCPACTLHNPEHFLRCSVCSTARSKQILTDGWTCMTCGEEGMSHEFWSCRFCGCIKDASASA